MATYNPHVKKERKLRKPRSGSRAKAAMNRRQGKGYMKFEKASGKGRLKMRVLAKRAGKRLAASPKQARTSAS